MWEKTLHGSWGRNGILKKLNQASRRKKAYHKGILVIQISQWIPKFYLCDESNPINPQCGKISANFYISPPHLPHPQFYPRKCCKFRYTSWLTPKNCISIDLRGAQVNNGVSSHQPHHCLLNRLFRRRSKKTLNLRVTGLCEGHSPVTGEFPAQMASKAENVSIWWRHHLIFNTTDAADLPLLTHNPRIYNPTKTHLKSSPCIVTPTRELK